VREINMNKKGFTLIELLIVVVIIGILAAIAIPRFGQTRERAFVSAMQSDLRQVMNSQELYYQLNGFEYAAGTASNQAAGAATLITDFEFTPSQGVQVVIAGSPTVSTGYTAVATHSNTSVRCEVFVGDATSAESIATTAGVIACDDGSTGS
jgi:type IV pilus assembly protein PilA